MWTLERSPWLLFIHYTVHNDPLWIKYRPSFQPVTGRNLEAIPSMNPVWWLWVHCLFIISIRRVPQHTLHFDFWRYDVTGSIPVIFVLSLTVLFSNLFFFSVHSLIQGTPLNHIVIISSYIYVILHNINKSIFSPKAWYVTRKISISIGTGWKWLYTWLLTT